MPLIAKTVARSSGRRIPRTMHTKACCRPRGRWGRKRSPTPSSPPGESRSAAIAPGEFGLTPWTGKLAVPLFGVLEARRAIGRSRTRILCGAGTGFGAFARRSREQLEPLRDSEVRRSGREPGFCPTWPQGVRSRYRQEARCWVVARGSQPSASYKTVSRLGFNFHDLFLPAGSLPY